MTAVATATRSLVRLPEPSEKEVEHAVDGLMATCGFDVVRFSQARASQQTPGIPDRRYVHAELPVALWFEVKRPSGTWSKAQQDFAAQCQRVGEIYVVGTTVAAYAVLREMECADLVKLIPQGRRQYVGSPRALDLKQDLLVLGIDLQASWPRRE